MAQLKDTIVSGNLRVTDTTLTDTLQVTTIKAPTSSGGTTYGPGTSGQVLKSNGTSVYWGSDSNSVTGVKGNAESSYRTGNVNLTPANIGALASTTKYAGSSSAGGAATSVATEVGNTAGARPVFYAYLGDNTRVVYNTNFTYNPSGNVLTATKFVGALQGNADTATILQTARNINGVSFDGSADITIPRSIKHIHTASGTEGTAGWVKIARITVTAIYANHPMTFTIAQRGVTQYRIHLVFVNNGSVAAAAISQFIIARDNSWTDTNNNPRAYIIKPSDGIFDLYIRKTEGYDHIFVVDFTKADNNEGDNYSVTWTNVHAADSAITGGTEATKKTYSTTDHTHNYAGSSSVGGAATSANKINTDAGATNRPVYFSDGVPVQCDTPASGSWFKGVPLISTDGVMEFGKYIDFHNTNGSNADYDYRMEITTTTMTLHATGSSNTLTIKSPGNTQLSFQTTSSGKAYTSSGITCYPLTTSGMTSLFNFGGNLVIGGGESAKTLYDNNYDTIKTAENEDLYLCADNDIHIVTGCKTYADKSIIEIDALGKVYLPATGGIIVKQRSDSNYVSATTWWKGGTAPNSGEYAPQIGQHNTGGDSSYPGSICILPYKTTTSPWGGQVGLFIQKNHVYIDGVELSKSTHTHNYLPIAGGTMEGNISFKSISGNTYPIASNKIIWNGGTDGIDIYYNLRASDAGELIMNMRDDTNVRISFAYNGTVKSYIDTNGNFSGNATTSSSWATARTLTLGGQLTGSVSVKGNANMTLNGYLKNSVICDGSQDFASYAWHKFAETTISDDNADRTITFIVSKTWDNPQNCGGILTAHIRTNETKVHNSSEFYWQLANADINPADFVLVYTNTANTSCKVELWYKQTSRWDGWIFTVLKEHNRVSIDNAWTLYTSTGHGSATHTAGTRSYASTLAGLEANSLILPGGSGTATLQAKSQTTDGTYLLPDCGNGTYTLSIGMTQVGGTGDSLVMSNVSGIPQGTRSFKIVFKSNAASPIYSMVEIPNMGDGVDCGGLIQVGDYTDGQQGSLRIVMKSVVIRVTAGSTTGTKTFTATVSPTQKISGSSVSEFTRNVIMYKIYACC